MLSDIEYPSIWRIMREQNTSICSLSKKTGIAYITLRDRMTGRTMFKLDEAILIKKALHSKLPLEELFKRGRK